MYLKAPVQTNIIWKSDDHGLLSPVCIVFRVIWNARIQEVTFEAHTSRLTTGATIRAFNKLKWTDKERRYSEN